MKKVLLAFDGTHFSEGAFAFAKALHMQQPLFLTGVFVPQISYANLWSYAGGLDGLSSIPLLEGEDALLVQQNVDRFTALCRQEAIPFAVHKDYFDFALPELKRETRFADLLILGSESFFQFLPEGPVNENMRDTLHASECPVLLVPETFSFPRKVVLAYDGSAASVFAIRQFSYLFPHWRRMDTLLVHLGLEKDMPEYGNITELVRHHFPNLQVLKAEGGGQRDFGAWLGMPQSMVLVAGSYGRSLFSQLFHGSFAGKAIAEHRFPVFIAHR